MAAPTRLRRSRKLRVLDFDIETLAAGYADPAWVPSKIMAIAWSWVDLDYVEVSMCGKEGFFDSEARARMIEPFLKAYDEADWVTGHNIIRFDLPVLNAEMMRVMDGRTLGPKMVQDTMKLRRALGFKKGQDNLATLLKVDVEKHAMNWQQWMEAYETDDWEELENRVRTDVMSHKLIREELMRRGHLKPPVVWRP